MNNGESGLDNILIVALASGRAAKLIAFAAIRGTKEYREG